MAKRVHRFRVKVNWHYVSRLALLLLTLTPGIEPVLASHERDTELSQHIVQLDDSYQQLVNRYYRLTPDSPESIEGADQLLARIMSTSQLRHPLPAIQMLVANLDKLVKSRDPAIVAKLADFMLRHNQRQLADRIHSAFEASGDEAGSASIRFNQAKYHARLQHWEKVHELLADTFSELSGNNFDHAYLLQGSALQHMKQHRLSMASYANIPDSSEFYVQAQLNTAIASLRQGWVTEARFTISKVIPVSRDTSPELTDRLNLVLGHALLHKQYYRDAHSAFKQVAQNSRYASKALLGTALTAINQKDYIGGLNVLTTLKSRQENDLSVDEAYLIMPFLYQRLNQPNRTVDSFLDSIDHFQLRLLELNALKSIDQRLDQVRLDRQSGDVLLGKHRFPFSRRYPFYLVTNRQHLSYLSGMDVPQLKNEIQQLLSEYDETLGLAIADVIDQRRLIYTSYLSQSRYGLARYYDVSKKGGE